MGAPWNYDLFVNGEWTEGEGGGRIDVIDPATEESIGSVAEASPKDAVRAIEAARKAFDEGPWPYMKPAERAAALLRMADGLEARGAELRDLIVAETGSTGFITDFVQAGGSIGMFRSNAEQVQHAVEWVENEPPTGGPTSVGGSAIVREPIGVVAAITPFNFPFMLNVVKSAPALAAGCTIVLKPHPWTPLDAFVIAQVADIDRRNPDDLATIYVRNDDGLMIPMNNIITVTERVAPKELNHFNKLRSATITATLAPGYTLGDALSYLQEAAQRVLPGSALVDYAGQSREFKESSASLYVTFLLALGFIYLVLSAQFESFVDPFIIMLTVPLSMTGALLALHLSGGTLNVYSQIGLITLVGLITKHGILIVEFSNQLQAQGRSKVEAVIEAAGLRLRPILMTTGAMVLGAVPLALATGAGAQSRQDIGWVIVGGLLVGTFFTLFVIPAVYTYLSWRERRAPTVVRVEDRVPEQTLEAAE